jgi:hypothetical protein
MNKSKFYELVDTFENQSGTVVEDTRTRTCCCIEFAEDGFPHHHSLGAEALECGFLISAVQPENKLTDEGVIAVFFKPFSTREVEETVEVRKTGTKITTDKAEYVDFDS